jgi:hypothetical protein
VLEWIGSGILANDLERELMYSQAPSKIQKYSVNQHHIDTILAWIRSGEIAIPEIQRPFVWNATKIRDLMDSLYQGYPVGYLIAWRNPTIHLKDGKKAEGKKILIDGQQRVTALTAAMLGESIIDKDYRRVKIQISFNPSEERFEVFNPAIAKDVRWLPDISVVFDDSTPKSKLKNDFCRNNPDINEDYFYDKIDKLKSIKGKQIGLIELDPDLDIETVTEIFIRINSKGMVLSQADFTMSKMAANDTYGGAILRKCIDYFCHLAIAPEFYDQIKENDKEFADTEYFRKISWLKNENDDLYDPDYNDLLRVSLMTEFSRGKMGDLVSLLSGRNFEAKTYEEEVVERSFRTLKDGILKFINETNFKSFVMIIRSAGFISPSLIRSQNTLNFSYALYLALKNLNQNKAEIEGYVRRWFVLSILTGRYSSSPESNFDYDIKHAMEYGKKFGEYLADRERALLSDAYWDFELVQKLETPITSSPYFLLFLAAQIKANDKGFLSRDIQVLDLINIKGDVHHIFPKDFLKKSGLTKSQYNQVANLVCIQSEVNKQLGNKAPRKYFAQLKDQCSSGKLTYGGICDFESLSKNLEMNCIPEDVVDFDFDDYEEFLKQRRVLMAKKIRDYYFSL